MATFRWQKKVIKISLIESLHKKVAFFPIRPIEMFLPRLPMKLMLTPPRSLNISPASPSCFATLNLRTHRDWQNTRVQGGSENVHFLPISLLRGKSRGWITQLRRIIYINRAGRGTFWYFGFSGNEFVNWMLRAIWAETTPGSNVCNVSHVQHEIFILIGDSLRGDCVPPIDADLILEFG